MRREEKNTKGLTSTDIKELQEIFKTFSQHNGKINTKELKYTLQSLGFDGKNLATFSILSSLESLGKEVNFDQFLIAAASKDSEMGSRASTNKLFEFYDNDRSGTIKLEDLVRVGEELGDSTSPTELEEILGKSATNGRQLSKEDFYHLVSKKYF